MKVQHSGPERVYLAPFGDFVEPNTPVEVSDDAGASLIEQGWTSPKTANPKTPKPKTPKPVKSTVEPKAATAEED